MEINLPETVTTPAQAEQLSSVLTYLWYNDCAEQAALAVADGKQTTRSATPEEVAAVFSHVQKFLDECIGQLDDLAAGN